MASLQQLSFVFALIDYNWLSHFTYWLQVVICVEEVPNEAHYVQLLTDSLNLCQLQHKQQNENK